ncbi:MAG: NAD(P)H-quinone oxidoreductase subunit N [Gloeomargaritaceae cyanobacterium C42_A2020_066]|nr:NAD(P)H-quinone oxidoreductase subunit N [Gloeomargaritaceae cyanobacterium C42_A2020_066]
MSLVITGNKFVDDLGRSGALAAYVPPEGGHEGRYQRRLRAAGYRTLHFSARGLGDLEAYLTRFHGVRPPHLGKHTIGQAAAVGEVYYFPPLVDYNLAALPPKSKGLVLWIIEGKVLSRQELTYLTVLTRRQPQVKVVVEIASSRSFEWKPLAEVIG